MKIVKETENLCRLTQLGMINCFLVRESGGWTLVDTGLQGSARAILRAAEELGGAIRDIALTHAHLDHIGSLDKLAATLPHAEIAISKREARLLARDFTLEEGESGKGLYGFTGAKTRPTRLLVEGDFVGSLKAISSLGHTPGHFSFVDVRDNSLLAGDAFTTQTGVVVAGVFKPFFPFPAIFSWNASLAATSARKLRSLNPRLLAAGHGQTIFSPVGKMDAALQDAYRQHPEAEKSAA